MSINARGQLNAQGENETVFLQELDMFAQSGQSNADRLIAAYNGGWDGDIMQAYRDCVY